MPLRGGTNSEPFPPPWIRPLDLGYLRRTTSPRSGPAALPVYAVTQARSATSAGSTRESRDHPPPTAAAWRGSRGGGAAASLPPACLPPPVRRPSKPDGGRAEAGCRLRAESVALGEDDAAAVAGSPAAVAAGSVQAWLAVLGPRLWGISPSVNF